MSRFGNLEFDAGAAAASEHRTPVKDERFFLNEGREAFEHGRFEQALRAYAKVLEHNPKAAAAWTGQVRSLIELGEFSEARVWADKGLAAFPDEPELLAAKAVALARAGDLQGAIAYSDAAVEARTSTPYIWLARGDVLLARKEKRAEYCFEKARAAGGNGALIHWLIARIQAYYQHFAKALKAAMEALSLEPGRAVFWLEAGKCQLELGLVTQARNSLEQARELDPECAARDYLKSAADQGLLSRWAGCWRRWFRQ